MTEVSCRAFSYFSNAAAAGVIDLDVLIAGLPVTRADLESVHHRLPWDVWVAMCERMAQGLGSDERVIDSARYSVSDVFAGDLGRIASFLGDMVQVYRMALLWGAPGIYRCTRFVVERLDDDRVEVSCEIIDGFRASRVWQLLVEGGLAVIPQFVGYGAAKVERLQLDDRSARWRVTPPKVPIGRPVGKQTPGTAAISAASIVDELAGQQEQLSVAWSEMRRSARAFQNTLDALPLLLAVHDHGRALYVNPALCTFLGTTQEHLVGTRLLDLAASDSKDAFARLLDEDALDAPLQVGISRAAGVGWVEARSVGGFEFGGQEARLLVGVDVSAELAARASLERSEATVHALLHVFPDLVLRIDEAGRLLDVQGGRSMQGAARLREFIGRRLSREALDGMPQFTASMAEELVDVLDSTGRNALEFALTGIGTDGQPRSLHARVVLIPGGERFLILHDDTERRAVERRLAVAERMSSLGTLAAGVAHEINNPIGVMLGYVMLLRKDAALADREELTIIEDELRQCQVIVAGLLDLARPVRLHPAEVDLDDLAREAVSRLEESGQLGGVSVQVDGAGGARVHADEGKIKQVVFNLLINAVDAARDKGARAPEVRVAARVEGGRAYVEIVDRGAGMPAEVKMRLFEPFHSTKPRGHGLGLAIARTLARAHGGDVELTDGPGGVGTRATVWIPQEAPKEPV